MYDHEKGRSRGEYALYCAVVKLGTYIQEDGSSNCFKASWVIIIGHVQKVILEFANTTSCFIQLVGVFSLT